MEKSIFINCPFDDDYIPMRNTIFFVCLFFGIKPVIASNRDDSSEERMSKISQMILSCEYSFHDISRIECDSNKMKYPRMNMPFELGIEMGIRVADSTRAKNRKSIIFDSEKYRYQKFLSDLSGRDIKFHEDSPEILSRTLAKWLKNHVVKNSSLVAPSVIWEKYNSFWAHFNELLMKSGYSEKDIEELESNEIIEAMEAAIESGISV